jgi:hypothetical protein
MSRGPDDYIEAKPHEDKPRMYRIGRWVTDCRLAKGWTMVDVAMRIHTTFPHSHLGNQGRISELETGNGVKRERWTAEVIDFLHSIFEPCPPPPEAPWELSDEYLSYQARKEAEAEARRLADLARRQGKPQPALEALWDDDMPEVEPAGAE